MKQAGLLLLALGVALGCVSVCAPAAAAPGETLFAGSTGNQRVIIGEPDGTCRLDRTGVRESVGLPASGAKNASSLIEGIAVLAVAGDPSVSGAPSRLAVVDMRCRTVQVLKDPYRVPAPKLYETLLFATRTGHLDIQADDGKWGAWNLRTNDWDPAPCCATPLHGFRATVPSDALSASPLWALLRPAAWVYALAVGVCALVAIALGYRGLAILGQAMVILPVRAVWLILVMIVAANLYAIAGLCRSGALMAVASGTLHSATRAWRR